MLCYAWGYLKEDFDSKFGVEDFSDIHNLLAALYVNGTTNLIKRGLNRYYIERNEDLTTIKGKIDLSKSLTGQGLVKKRVNCHYDEFSKNIVLNQIVRTTLELLSKDPIIKRDINQSLVRLMPYFSNVKKVQFSHDLFSKMRYTRNNYHYQVLINISYLIYQGLIASDEGEEITFNDFIRDSQMATLFEKFVLNYYKEKLSKEYFYVHSPKIKWQMLEQDSNLKHLPSMQTDITIENKKENWQLIIDTKFYANTLVESYWGYEEKVRNQHLYQLFTYVNNSHFTGEVRGMLLYPAINKEVDQEYSLKDNNLYVKTLNLNQDFNSIVKRLESLIQ
jgi:5-methylcytosine-specific restriction enzyme subunit McrC